MSNNPNEKPVPENHTEPSGAASDDLQVSTEIISPLEGAAFSSHEAGPAAQTIEMKTRPAGSVPPVKKKKKKKRRLRKEIRYALAAIAVVLAAWLLYSLLFRTGNTSSQTPDSSGSSGNVSASQNQGSSDTNAEGAYTVLIDPGHGGFDGGNVSDDGLYMEKDINITIAQKVKADLEALNPKVRVIMTRNDDSLDWAEDEISDLMGRTNKQKETNADFFVSLHCNAFPGDASVEGYTLFINSYDPFMKKLAENLDGDFQESGWSQLDGIVEDNALHVVSLASIPSILVEMGYMTNPNDMAGLVDESTQDTIAQSIAQAINDTWLENEALLKQTKQIYKEKQPKKDALISQNVPQASDPSTQNQENHADSSSDSSGEEHQETESSQ